MGEWCLAGQKQMPDMQFAAAEVAGVSKSLLSKRSYCLFKRNPPG